MAESQSPCYACGHINSFLGNISFRANCSNCYQDIHVCKNCVHYDEKSYNECREPSAERITDKERANYCDHFVIKLQSAKSGGLPSSMSLSHRDQLRAQAEALFASPSNAKSSKVDIESRVQDSNNKGSSSES